MPYQRKTMSIFVTFGLFMLCVFPDQSRAVDVGSQTFRDTRKNLKSLEGLQLHKGSLASLFKTGDNRISDLIQALDDDDEEISLGAQIIIRYLGNEKGMQALYDWYGRHRSEYAVAGPIPLPLKEWDYEYIKRYCIDGPVKEWGDREVEYIYALLLDHSATAKGVLNQITQKAKSINPSSMVAQALKDVRENKIGKIPVHSNNLAAAVLNAAFFISPQDRKYTTARLLALNGDKDKALIEIYINRGVLAKEWYHVVVILRDGAWGFYSISQIRVS